jgi:hypothetical protein
MVTRVAKGGTQKLAKKFKGDQRHQKAIYQYIFEVHVTMLLISIDDFFITSPSLFQHEKQSVQHFKVGAILFHVHNEHTRMHCRTNVITGSAADQCTVSFH